MKRKLAGGIEWRDQEHFDGARCLVLVESEKGPRLFAGRLYGKLKHEVERDICGRMREERAIEEVTVREVHELRAHVAAAVVATVEELAGRA